MVQDTLTHDDMGNTTKSVMESAETEDGSRIVSSSTYTNGGNLVSSVTERGNTTKYGYNGSYNRMTGQESDVTDPSNAKASYTYDAAGRTKSTTITRIGNTGTIGTVTYDYTRGLLTKLTRNTNGQNQVYNLSYDTLGNLTKMQVGSRTLMTYTYGAKNGPWNVKPTATERIRSTNTTAWDVRAGPARRTEIRTRTGTQETASCMR